MTSREERKHLELVTPYNENFYHHIEDYRIQEEIEFQHKKMDELYFRNTSLFGIEITQKKKVKYEPRKTFKLDLGDGWYLNITDNGLKKQNTVITLHGAPGDHRQWAGLEEQMQGTCRWINVIIPGFDQEDQRRGSYIHNSDQFSEMIVRMIKKLELGKVIYCGHSLGSIFGAFFIQRYPEYVKGYINITGIANHWYIGLLGFFNKCIGQWNFNNPEQRKKIFSMTQQQRLEHHSQFLKQTSQYYFGPVKFPQLTLNEYYGYIKLFNTFPNGISENYRKNMDHKLLRVLFFGRKDPLHKQQLTDAFFYYYCFNHQAYVNSNEFKKILTMAKSELQEKMWQTYGVKQFKVFEIQSYFVYHFQDTGHNAHKRRPKQIAKIMKIYIDCLNILEKYQTITQSKL